MTKYILVLLLSTVFDFVLARFVQSVAKKKRGMAAVLSASLAIISSLFSICVVEDHKMVIPIAIGAALGTYLGVEDESDTYS